MTELKETRQVTVAEEAKLAIQCRGLSKSFGSKPVLRRIDLDVEEGERLVIFGPNGAGKTTLIKVLATLTSPSGGVARLAGIDLREEAQLVRRCIGVVSHRTYLYDELTARENLRFYGRMYGLPNLEARIEEVVGYVGLRSRLDDRVRTFSRGMQQRMAIARAVLHEPSILLLDEPETGLDQWATSMLPELFGSLGAAKRTILMTTHSLEMGLRMADRVAILGRGRIIFSGPSTGLDVPALRDIYYQATGAAGARP